jgi:hypothetical protein
MQLTCQHCQAAWEFSDRRPSFCPFCGKSLPPELTTEVLPATAPSASEAETQACPPAAGSDAADPEVVGGYRLLRVIGVGGMGKVYEAEDTATGRRVALKLVSADYAGSADAVERFRQEGRLASLIAHPRCVFVLAADEEAGRPYIVMELMPGDSLDDYIRRNGPQPPAKAVRMILDVIEGLQEAHRVGVVHRDVKPSNCFFGEDGRLKVGDFGLSKSLAQGAHLTKTGSFLGTPLYASPEQVRGEHVDAQTDVYSVAATLYFMLTGRAPFQSDNAAVTLARIAADPAPPLRALRPELSPLLDRVVLRGLERDRKRRWQSLEEFAEALRPFLPGRLSLANLGVRFGAILLDYAALSLIGMCVGFFLLAFGVFNTAEMNNAYAYAHIDQLLSLTFWLLYFLPEAVWGYSLGKWLLGLQVRDVLTGHVPGHGRWFMRTCLSYILIHLASLIRALIVVPLLKLPAQPSQQEVFENFAAIMLLSFLPLVGWVVGIVLMLCTMRARNGYRGLHEFLSGTCVVPLPRRQRWSVLVTPASQGLSHPPGVPQKVGHYDVRAAFRWDEHVKALLGFDPVLGRQVVLWLRHRDEPPLAAKRREVSRTARLRWLSAGSSGERQWDAFVAPGGCPLTALAEANGRLTWPLAQPLLKQLADELAQAVQEGTLPAQLDPALVWVRPDGQAILLDMPLTGSATAGDPATDGAGAEDQALDLLARVAVLSLEGRPPPAELPGEVRAPLPLPAADVLRQLLGHAKTGLPLRVVQRRLAELEDHPPEVTRARRTGQLALMGWFLFMCFGCCLSPFSGTMIRLFPVMGAANIRVDREQDLIEDLDKASLSDYLAAASHPDLLARLRVVPALEADQRVRQKLQDDIEQTRKRMDERAKWEGFFYEMVVAQDHKQREDQRKFVKRYQPPRTGLDPGQLRRDAARQLEAPAQSQGEIGTYLQTLNYAGFFLGPVLWVVWAFLTRGGLSYFAAGIGIVRSDGRPAGRFRCAWRAFLVWIPLGVLVLAAFWLDDWYWSSNWYSSPSGPPLAPVGALWVSWLLGWTAWLLLGAYLILALRYPSRSPLDRLAGTYLVPVR